MLRFLFALAILFFHIHKRFAVGGNVSIGNTGIYVFNHGYIGVEFFFLVSGYLLAAGAYAKREIPTTLIGTENAKMMWKKVKNIFPYHLFAMIITIAVNAYFLKETAKERFYYVLDSWASVLFLQVFGFDSTWVNKLTWYLDVWLMVTFIFYYFLRKHYDTFAKIVCPLLALFVLGFLAHQYGSLADIDEWSALFYKCFLRGMSEMALGCSAYSITRALNKVNFSQSGKKVMAGLEILCYILVFIYAVTGLDPKYSFLALLVMFVGVIITFSEVNPCHRVFDHEIFSWMGKMSLLIYLNQFYAIRLVQEINTDMGFWGKFLFSCIFTFIGALICNLVVSWFNKHHPFRKLMLAQ
ncbi:MAG: acyltransferase family protein [Pseudobutyrivibrio sp.]|nr:acyltransferase family protein [Pseudobutyrivibrio sp.]